MARCLFGVETEYALAPYEHRGRALEQLLELARERLAHLPGVRGCDLFLANGSRLYIDCGEHPELATPECTTPYEVVRYVLAGDALLADLMQRIELPGGRKPYLFKGNVDYTGAGSTWGCHESFLCRTDPSRVPDQILSHLVSRIIYTGAGGFNSTASGIRFAVSPRAWHLHHAVSKESTKNRGIFHTKDESLSTEGYHRIHLICGESLRSETAMLLRTGTTALIVALIDAGKCPGRGLGLADPVMAMRTFTADPDCRATVPLKSGRRVTALEIQHRYLEAVEKHVGASFMPDWAPNICREWRRMLDRIENDPDSLARVLDWAMKRALFERRIEQSPIEPAEVPLWNHVVDHIDRGLEAGNVKGEATRVEVVLGTTSAIPGTIRGLDDFVRERSLDWALLRPFVNLRKELVTIDVRFTEVGGRLFEALDGAGVLAHRAQGVGSVCAAMTRCPSKGRARLRGQLVRRHFRSRGMRATWKSVWDGEKNRVLDMSDPFEEQGAWKDMSKRERANRILDLDFLDF